MTTSKTTGYDLDDVQSDITHLSHLLDETMEKVLDMAFVDAEGKRNLALDRVAALLWIARDLSERTERQLDENMRFLRNPGGRNV